MDVCSVMRWPRSHALLWIVLLGFSSARGAGAQYRATQWTAESGLPQNSVRGIVQTPDGYIWLATLNGIARFDGIRFTVFNKSNTPGITSNRFTSMVAGDGGDLWLASEDNNLIRFHAGRFTMLNEAAGVRPHSVGAVTADRGGSVWALVNEHSYRWSATKQQFERESYSDDSLHFVPLWWVGTGFWAQRDRQLICLVHGRLEKHVLPSNLKPEQIRGVAIGGDGTVWVGTHDGRLGNLIDGQYIVQTGDIVTDFVNQTRRNWKVHISQNFARSLFFSSGDSEDGIPYNVLLRDSDDNMWVGSEGEGLFRIQQQSITTLTSAQGLASDNVYPVMRARNGDIWAGSWPAGISLIRNKKVIRSFTKKDGLPGLVTALAEDKNGALWIGSHNGVRVFSNNHFSVPSGLPTDMPAAQVIFEAPEGAMLFGTPNGMYVLDGASSHWMTTRNGLAADDVRVIIADHAGALWIGGYGGLTRSYHGEITRWTEAQGLPSNNIRCIMEDASGQIWVGTYDGGIGWLRNGRWIVFNQDRGLFDNGAFQIIQDTMGNFWISSNSGIYRVRRSELEEVADGKRARVVSVAFGRADGMLSVECNGGLWPAGAKDDHGVLWFPTQKGVAIIDPATIRAASTPPRVKIESSYVEHNLQPTIQHVLLRPGQTNLEVNYTALTYFKPEQTSFRYMLEGVDDNWQEVGSRRTAYYSHLPPGEYTFRVSARNSDGVESADAATMAITVIPPFYRRPWFIALSLALILLAIRIAWAYRVRQLKKEQMAQQAFSRELIASQENERRRIAAELHDSLGQRLIVISNLALFLLRRKGKQHSEADKVETLEEISAEASHALEETRAISYALRPFQLDRLGLTKAIHALGKTIARASEIEITTNLENIDETFPEELRINFFRIVQEALNNIVKHSGATRGSVTVRCTKTQVTLSISDNGKGFSSEPRAIVAGPGGFGMTGMRERAMLLRGTMQIKSEVNGGTTLIIDFPIGVEQANERSHSSAAG